MMSREIGVVLVLVAMQIIWSQVYPFLRPFFADEAAPSPAAEPLVTAEELKTAIQSELRWLPPLDPAAPELAQSILEDGDVLPLFPLGTVFYAPFSSGVQLKIFEPRYRQMYTDVMSSPSPRFVVTAIDPDSEQLAEVGVVFRVDNLTDISERTGGQMKYIAKHTVVDRVRIRQVLNPHAWSASSSYLRADVRRLEEAFDAEDLTELEAEVLAKFREAAQAVLTARYRDLEATRQGLWQLADIWINQFLPSSLSMLQGRLQQELRQLPQAEAVKRTAEVQSKTMAVWRRTVNDQLKLGQALLQSTSHKQRLAALHEAIHAHTKLPANAKR